MSKTQKALLSLLLLIAATMGGFLWYQSELLPVLGRTEASGTMAIGGSYSLVNQDDRPIASGDFKGKYQLLYFGYTFCPDICPTTLAVMSAALAKLGADGDLVVPIFITVDPARDTPQVLKKYLAAFGPRFVGLTGTPQQIAKVEKEYRIYAKKQPLPGGTYSMTHSSIIYLVGPDDKLIALYNEPTSPDILAKDLEQKI